MTLKFSPGNHRYWCDKKPIPGVTTLIKKGLPAEALMYWSARQVAEFVADNESNVEQLRSMGRGPMVAALKEVPWQKRDEAAAKGTEVHALAVDLVHGLPVVVPEHITGHVNGYAHWLDRFGVEPILTERAGGNREHWYAGTPDLVALIRGCRWLLDLKTARGVYGDTAMQTDAYRNLEFYVDPDDPDTEHPFPEEIERLGVVHVTDSGTSLYALDSTGDPFRKFLHCAYIAKNRDAIKGYLGSQITEPDELEIAV